MSSKAPRPRGKISPVVYDTVRSIGGGDLDTIWTNIVAHDDKPSRKQVEYAVHNGVDRGYYIFQRRGKKRVYFVASNEHYMAFKRKRVAKSRRKAQARTKHKKVVAKKPVATPVVSPPRSAKPTDFSQKWVLIAALAGASWGFLTGFALCVWVVA
jgi:hypothetical protein